MLNLYGINIFDFDIYSKRISFFFNQKDKIGTVFGLCLTFLYILITSILFIIYLIKTIKRTDAKSNEMTLYSQGLPSINIRPELLYFAFALENPITLNRYIDESIYNPKVYFIMQNKENGITKIKEKSILNIEKCDVKKFGKEYQGQFIEGELNNAYCLKDFNLTLLGGSKYEKSSFIQIKIHPCVNTSQNNNHCKSQKIIDSYLTSGYFSIIIKDIGLNPLNYSFPIIPTIQNLKTNVDITMCREALIYLGITEIHTDVGLFVNSIKKENHLEYRKYSQSFFFINESEYHNGKEIFSAEIKLEEYIHVQKREYTKMSEVFSVTGGYMQLISTIFGLFTIFIKSINVEKKILNNLFNFNIKQRKIILSINYNKKLKYLIYNEKKEIINSFIPFHPKKVKAPYKNLEIIHNLKKNEVFNSKENYNNYSLKKVNVMKNIHSGKDINLKYKKENRLKKYNIIEKGDNFKVSQLSNLNLMKNEQDYSNINRSKIILFKDEDLTNQQINNIFRKKKLKKERQDNTNDLTNIQTNDNDINQNIDLSILKYYFSCKKNRNKKIELFNFGITFYRNQMSIINIFNLIFMMQILLVNYPVQKFNILNQIIEISA